MRRPICASPDRILISGCANALGPDRAKPFAWIASIIPTKRRPPYNQDGRLTHRHGAATRRAGQSYEQMVGCSPTQSCCPTWNPPCCSSCSGAACCKSLPGLNVIFRKPAPIDLYLTVVGFALGIMDIWLVFDDPPPVATLFPVVRTLRFSERPVASILCCVIRLARLLQQNQSKQGDQYTPEPHLLPPLRFALSASV